MRGGDPPGSTVVERREAAWPRFEEIEAEASRIAHYQAGKLVEGDEAGFVAQAARSAASQVLARANASVPAAASRRGGPARYARVLRGPEPCGWCFVLAARGFDYSSAEAASHSHRGCRCLVVPGDADGAIEGYDLGGIQGRYRALADACGPGAAAEKVVRFAELHDPGWLYDGRPVEADYSEKPRKRLENHEMKTVDDLERMGIRPKTLAEDEFAAANIDLLVHEELWEMKNVGDGKHAIEDRLRDSSKKWEKLGSSLPVRTILTAYGTRRPLDELCAEAWKRRRYWDECIVIAPDGTFAFLVNPGEDK